MNDYPFPAKHGLTRPDTAAVDVREALRKRITDYLSGGGLFNPEMANHGAVRDLLIECRAALQAHKGETK